MNTIGQRIKAARDHLKLSQKELARRVGVSAGTIGNHESGARDKPRELNAIAAALGVDAAWLERGVGPDPWKPIQHVGEGPAPYKWTVAHQVSHSALSHSLPTLS